MRDKVIGTAAVMAAAGLLVLGPIVVFGIFAGYVIQTYRESK